ncbi:hypothetical protein EFA69_03905 [Rufibacter immobilis]|uniref:Uncharacterized protein n=1 Tax=Rufibacter immobilis TaxID=1348778 RepID=A0A3M9N589_9BACT|nr:hypothetical protein EFA69_03905 [Rufibacter immobilis]
MGECWGKDRQQDFCLAALFRKWCQKQELAQTLAGPPDATRSLEPALLPEVSSLFDNNIFERIPEKSPLEGGRGMMARAENAFPKRTICFQY